MIKRLDEKTFQYHKNEIEYVTTFNERKECFNVVKEPEEDEKLRTISDHIENINNDLIEYLQEYLLITMYKENGIGIASIQCGIPLRVFIVDIPIITTINGIKPLKSNPRYIREAIQEKKKIKKIETRPIYKNGRVESYNTIEEYYGFENNYNDSIQARAIQIENEIDEIVEIQRNPVFLINPQIINLSTQSIAITEGCLSVPLDYVNSIFGSDASVLRPLGIEISYTNINDEIERINADGSLGDHEKWLSRCIQHEYDHLEGILFTDKLFRPNETITTTNG